ncbi:MAG: hypothetical protein HWE22_05635 [Flavobacteriales bacterium]|nr:hypothetical protein [Flavobacteriales bacterium]
MTNNFSVLFKKYSVPVLLLILGITLLVIGVMKDQGLLFKSSSILMFLAGALSLLYSSGKMKTMFLVIFGVFAGIAGIVMLGISWNEVSDEVKTQNRNELLETTAKQNLQDVVFIQKKYQERNGVYAGTWDELTEFLKNGKVDYVVASGSVPPERLIRAEADYLYGDNRALDNNMTELEAWRLSKWEEGPRYNELFRNFKRDTLEQSILEAKFESRSYLEARKLSGLGQFYPDSLRYIPMTNGKEEWKLETIDSLELADGTKAPAVKVSGTLPFIDKEMYFGSLTSPNELSGSWENEK